MQYVLGAFALLVAALVITRLWRDRQRAPHLQQAQGTVVDKWFTGRSGTGNERAFAQYHVNVHFTTVEGGQVSGTARGRYRAAVARERGQPIQVWYDRSDPGYFQLIAPGSLLGAWPFVAILVLVLAAALAFVAL